MKWRSLEESGEYNDTRPLREIFAERKKLIAQYVPPATQAIHERVVSDLNASGMLAGVLQVGAKIPEVTLQDHNKKPVTSSALLAKGRLVVCFIRGRWCPFCVGQLQAMNFIVPQIREAGAELIAISPQIVSQAFFMADQHRLRFPLLSDPHNEVARKFGLVYRVPEEQQALYRRTFVNLPHANGDDSWELPIPATFIVDRDGAVTYAYANPDYTERPEPLDILARLELDRA
jgi:peroxiredoxin